MPVIAILRRLRADRRAAALVEFALALPLLLAFIGGCIELANFAVAREQVSQLALMVADNASRMGAQDVLKNKPISEGEIEDLFRGAQLQSGRVTSDASGNITTVGGLDIQRNGRIVLSSLEKKSDGSQYIHWQRCYGASSYQPAYGRQGAGALDKSVTGMGPASGRVQAGDNMPVMFVEVAYNYVPVMLASFGPLQKIVETAALTVRDDRDLKGADGSGVNPTAGVIPRYCLG